MTITTTHRLKNLLLNPVTLVIGGLLVGGLVTALLLSFRSDDSMMISDEDRASSMLAMMGTKDSSALPLKKAADAKPLLEPVVASDGTKMEH